MKVDLSLYTNPTYNPGASVLKRAVWHIFSQFFIDSQVPVPVSFKRRILTWFGAKVGKGVVIKPGVKIKHPWYLEVGDYSWIGEEVWIDNLVPVKIGANCCISQGAMLLTGNHNYKKPTFDLITGSIVLADGVWVGAKAVVCPGVKMGTHAVLTVSSVATKECMDYEIYQGNPAISVKMRTDC